MTAVTLNPEQRLFVLRQSGGYSCLGFDVVFKRLKQYAKALGWGEPSEQEIGKLSQYEAYLSAERAFIATNPKDTCFDPDTPVAVQRVLEAYRKSGQKIRVFLGDAKTGRDWHDEHDVVGTIGRSMGPLKVPLLISGNDCGGPALLTACIVRLMDAKTKQELYRHPTYQAGTFSILPSDFPGYSHEVQVNEQRVARFRTLAAAQRWVAFMKGERMST